MAGGRPTSDPKNTLLAVRLSERHVQFLQQRARRDGVNLSEALRRLLDERVVAAPPRAGRPPTRGRPPTAAERKMFDQLFGAFGLKPSPRRRRSRG